MPKTGRTLRDLHDDAAYQRWLGGRIRELRQAAKLNQDDFSDLTGLQRSYVGLVENGKKDLRVGTLRRIAEAFGLDVHHLLDPAFEIKQEALRVAQRP